MSTENVTDANFDELVLQVPGLVLLDVWAPWCGPCKMVGSAAEKVAARDNSELKLVMANLEEFQKSAEQLNVRATPTLIVFKDGKEIARRSGAVMEAQIAQWIDQMT